MGQNNTKTLTMAMALLVGVFCSFLWGTVLIPKQATPQTINDGLTLYYIIYMVIAAVPLSVLDSVTPWAFSGMLVLGSYVSGLIFIPYFGQFGPFDMIFLFIYTIPGIIAAFAAQAMKSRILKTKNA